MKYLSALKKPLFIIAVLILSLNSCERFKFNPEQEIIFKIDKDLEYKYSDIEMYDSSTHILYFKTVHPEFADLGKAPFTFMANGEEIYTGYFWPGYLSSSPPGPFIFSFSIFHQIFALSIENWRIDKPDVRNDPRIIQTLKDRHLLHSGLSVKIKSIESIGSLITFSFTVTNQDKSDLLILDPDKMGINLFHYFTNGLTISDLKNKTTVYNSDIERQNPSPWNSWKIDWLSRITPGESKTFVFNYPVGSPLNPGEYHAFFEFPGLSYQVNKDQLIQDNGRIWLGDIRAKKDIVIK